MRKSMRDQLKQWQQLNQPPKIKHKKKRARKPQKERLTERDIKDLMGTNRARYSRGKGGAYKQR